MPASKDFKGTGEFMKKETPELKKLSERISYLPAGSVPLSSDIGLIHGDKCEWIFDVGNNEEAVRVIQGIYREKNIILSHFHEDHTGNLERITYKEIYCGDYTRKKLGRGTTVKEPLTFEDGVKITIFPIPSSHVKGAVGIEADEQFAFLGDAIYSMVKNGRTAFNVTLLQEMLSVLESLKAEHFLLSHDTTFVKSKTAVVKGLTALYKMRKQGEPYLFL